MDESSKKYIKSDTELTYHCMVSYWEQHNKLVDAVVAEAKENLHNSAFGTWGFAVRDDDPTMIDVLQQARRELEEDNLYSIISRRDSGLHLFVSLTRRDMPASAQYGSIEDYRAFKGSIMSVWGLVALILIVAVAMWGGNYH